MKKWILLLVCFLCVGCSVWEQITKLADQIITGGETAARVAPIVSTFNPVLGLWVMAGSIGVVAFGKILKLF